MNEEISALMDGQLGAAQTEGCLKRLKADPEARTNWDVYHLIGDTLRGHVMPGLAAGFHEKLDAEPTILAPRLRTARLKAGRARIALSAAASVAAVGFVGWMSYPFFSTSNEQLATSPPVLTAPATTLTVVPVSQNLDDYHMAHQRFAPGIGVAPYARTVSAADGQR